MQFEEPSTSLPHGQSATKNGFHNRDTTTITCTACQVQVIGSEERRKHYRSDLHLVNLKRKMSGMGPLTLPEFTQRLSVLQQNKRREEEEKESIGRRRSRNKVVCEICHKTFSSRQAFLNHSKSRRHLDAVNKQDTDMSEISSVSNGLDDENDVNEFDKQQMNTGTGTDWSYAEDDEDDELTVDDELRRRLNNWDPVHSDRRCVFYDSHGIFTSPSEALKHMAMCSGFFVPFKEYLCDAAGLVRYLAQKVCVGYACIACDKGFNSANDARNHMQDIGHCGMTSNEDAFFEEYDQFYDWTKPQNDNGKNSQQDDDNDGWIECNDEDDIDDENQSAIMVVPSNKEEKEVIIDGRPCGPLRIGGDDDDDGDENHPKSIDEAYALAIGSKVIGHRSLARYYKQTGGTNLDMRGALVANRAETQMRIAAMKAKRRTTQIQANGQNFAVRRRQCFELSVGKSNYYVRKSRFRQNMIVLNSGYRA